MSVEAQTTDRSPGSWRAATPGVLPNGAVAEPTPARKQIVVRLPSARWSGTGEVLMQPNVHVYQDDEWESGTSARNLGGSQRPSAPVGAASESRSTGFASYMPPPEGLPAPAPLGGPTWAESELETLDGEPRGPRLPQPVFEELFGEPEPCEECEPDYGPPRWLLEDESDGGEGLGRERLPNALFEIDAAQPFNNYRLRFNSFYRQHYPDRAEYLWAKTGTRGPPLPENLLDFQELRILMESGSEKFSTGIEIPFRWTNPDVNDNHAGIGDLRLTLKTVLFEGEKIMLTQIFRTQFNTGSSRMGMGTGHIALEPGFLARYHWGDRTWLHGELKYQFPTGGTPVFSGQVLEYGLGISYLLWESDSVALIPTFEAVAWSVLNGTKTDQFGVPIPADVDTIGNLLPGLRIACDRGGDLGLVELGISGGWGVTTERFYEGMWRVECRIVY